MQRQRRAIVMGAGFVAVAAIARILPTLAARVQGTEESIASQMHLLQWARRELARGGVVLDSVRLLESSLPRVARLVLPGDTTTDVQRELARRVTMVITSGRARTGSIEAVADTTHVEGLAHARVLAAWESDIRGAMDVLSALEQDSALVVHSVEIRAVDPAGSTSEPEVLEVRTEVGGWHLRRDVFDRFPAVSGLARDSIES